MKKICSLTIIATCISFASMAQTVKDKIEKVSRDPKTVENAAKADASVVDKKIIVDSTIEPNKTSGTIKKSGRRKAGSCKHK